MRLKYWSEARCYEGELFAVHSDAEIQAVIECIDAKGRGKTVGEWLLVDAHRGDADERT